MSKSSNKLSLHIGSEIGLKNFSFSQLIVEVKRLFDCEGIPGFVKMMVILVEKGATKISYLTLQSLYKKIKISDLFSIFESS